MSADQIKAKRRKAKMTQVEFAAFVGVTPATVSRWERGESSPHPLIEKNILKVCA